MIEIDYYELLEVSKSSDKTTIKKAYRKMAMQYHPDKNPGDAQAEERFKAINEAYQVLNDDQKRQIYDRHGKSGLEGQRQSRGFGGFDDMGSVFEEMFGSAFGGGFGSRKKQRKTYNYNLDIAIEINIKFNEAVFGVNKSIDYKYKMACKICKGSGAKDGKLSKCSYCEGHGQIHTRQGFMTFAQTCPNCNGSGESIEEECSSCSANGYEEVKETFKVDIPEGVNTGNQIRVSNKGNISPDGSRGDLYIQIQVKEDSHFVRQDDDIYLEVPIFFTQVVLGDNITIPSLKGELTLKIPAGTKDKKQFRFKNEGVKSVQSNRKGDLVVQISIKYPTDLNNEQRQLLEKLQESFGIESKPYASIFEGMFDRVKKWFS